MIDRSHALPVTRQAKALGISRGSVYYLPRPVSEADLKIMRRIDELHLELPFAGSRMLRDLLGQEGIEIGRQHVAALMKKMAITAIYRRPNTSKPAPGHKIYPYLLRKLPIVRPNQVWATDISYIPMAKGFVYLVAIVDWFSRKVLAHRVSITMEADFCVEALEEALARYGKPETEFSEARFSTPTRAANSHPWRSLACCCARASLVAWMAAVRGATMSWSNGCGARSNTRRCTCAPMPASARRGLRSANI